MDSLKGMWRLSFPIRAYWAKHPFKLVSGYYNFFRSWITFQKMNGNATLRHIAPFFPLKQDGQTGGGHYFYQDIWALRHLARLKPVMHYDIGSRMDGFVGQATAICPVTCVDIRPPSFTLPDFEFIQGDILKLPFKDGTLPSVSCLHTIEHIGLGRYGDAINPMGFDMALLELQRVLAPGAFLILSMPIGRERVEFNAQRILDPRTCVKKLFNMRLVEFSVVTDQNDFVINTVPEKYIDAKYACGLFLFQKSEDPSTSNPR